MEMIFYSTKEDWRVNDMPYLPFVGMTVVHNHNYYLVESVSFICDDKNNRIHVELRDKY